MSRPLHCISAAVYHNVFAVDELPLFRSDKQAKIDDLLRFGCSAEHCFHICHSGSGEHGTGGYADTSDAIFRTELRDGCEVRTVLTERAFPTDECQLILEGSTPAFTFISLFAGEAAPKLPRPGEMPDPYWQSHLFIRDND